jgi:hypothetical protein
VRGFTTDSIDSVGITVVSVKGAIEQADRPTEQ